MANMKEISQEEYDTMLHSNVRLNSRNNKPMVKFANLAKFPMYAIHLFAWQLESLPWNPLKSLIKKINLLEIHESNYVLRLLFGAKIKMKDVCDFRPMCGTRWQEKFFDGFYSACEIIETNFYFNKIKVTSESNAVDNDLLWYLVEKYPDQIIKNTLNTK